MIERKPLKTNFNHSIIYPSLGFIIGISLLAALLPDLTGDVLNRIKAFVFVNLNWVYVWSVTIFVLFLLYLMFSKYGQVRLGRNDSQPEYSFFSLISMLFAAGMGICLMLFGEAVSMQDYTCSVLFGEMTTART